MSPGTADPGPPDPGLARAARVRFATNHYTPHRGNATFYARVLAQRKYNIAPDCGCFCVAGRCTLERMDTIGLRAAARRLGYCPMSISHDVGALGLNNVTRGQALELDRSALTALIACRELAALGALDYDSVPLMAHLRHLAAAGELGLVDADLAVAGRPVKAAGFVVDLVTALAQPHGPAWRGPLRWEVAAAVFAWPVEYGQLSYIDLERLYGLADAALAAEEAIAQESEGSTQQG